MPRAPRIVAVLDIGKTNVKVAAHDLAAGRDLLVRKAPNTVLRTGPTHGDPAGPVRQMISRGNASVVRQIHQPRWGYFERRL